MATFDHGYALLIGVGTHLNPRYSLPTTLNDVLALGQLLRDPQYCAYPEAHIRTLTNENATIPAITSALIWLHECAERDPDATIMVYYSGHGGRTATDDYALITHEATSVAEGFAAANFTAFLQGIPARRLLVILDCCHAEGMATIKSTASPEPLPWVKSAPSEADVAALTQGEGRVVLASSRGTQQSYIMPDRSLSVFTRHLLEALQGAGNLPNTTEVRVANVINYLGEHVPTTARSMHVEQTPWTQGSFEDFSLALIRGGKGLGPDGWDATAQAEATQVTDAIAQATQQIINTNQSGGVFMPGATIHGNPTIVGGNSYGGDHIQGNKYVNMPDPRSGVERPGSGHTPASKFDTQHNYRLVWRQPARWVVGVADDLEIQVDGLDTSAVHSITVRGTGIEAVTERFTGNTVAVLLTPQRAGDLAITIVLRDADGTQRALDKTMLVVYER